MALSVAQFAAASSMADTTTPATITGLSWSSGDIIVVMGFNGSSDKAISTPTNANLTFSRADALTNNSSSEAFFAIWTATAASAKSSQSINAVFAGGIQTGLVAWVITGSPSGTANITANRTESTISRTVSANSIVLYGFSDWNASTTRRTISTGSGTATERGDATVSGQYSWYAGDWVGTSAGTFSFGVTSYTGLLVGHGVIEILAPAGGSTVSGDASSSGTATGSFTGAATSAAAQSATGIAAVSFAGASAAASVASSSGIGSTSLVGAAIAAAVLSADGVGAMVASNSGISAAALISEGIAAFSSDGASIAEALLNSIGIAGGTAHSGCTAASEFAVTMATSFSAFSSEDSEVPVALTSNISHYIIVAMADATGDNANQRKAAVIADAKDWLALNHPELVDVITLNGILYIYFDNQ